MFISFLKYAFLGLILSGVSFSFFSLFVNNGFRPPHKTKINGSVPFDSTSAVKIYEQDPTTYEWLSTLVESNNTPGFLEYLDRLKGNGIEHFVIPVKFNYRTQLWEAKEDWRNPE